MGYCFYYDFKVWTSIKNSILHISNGYHKQNECIKVVNKKYFCGGTCEVTYSRVLSNRKYTVCFKICKFIYIVLHNENCLSKNSE
jgi:hypothetical protein